MSLGCEDTQHWANQSVVRRQMKIQR